jgi:hypothetical protein
MNILSPAVSTAQSQPTPLCVCLTYIGDNGPCPVHGAPSKRVIVDLPQIVAEAHRLPVHQGTHYGKEYRGLL